MKLTAVALLTGAVVAGVSGSAVAYQAAGGGDAAPELTSVSVPSSSASPSAEDAQQVVRSRKVAHKHFAPCKHAAHLEHGVCVTDVVRTVVVAPSPAATSSAPATPAPSGHTRHHGEHHAAEPGDDRGDHHGDHHGDEAGDDHGDHDNEPGDDHGGDDGGGDDD
jgi:hypothetical protein